ncbi:histone H1.1-like [Mobula hypostoma]|uniref:histone H1.1-like n=1 Tax=Mobula hypostoma TaxID=723540 RepID=UPI002FC2CFB6
MVARAVPGTSTAAQQQCRRRRQKAAGQPCRRRRRKTQKINQLIKQALSARKPCGGLSLSSLRAALLANGYDVEENRPRLQMAIGRERRRRRQQQQTPRGRGTDAAATTGCLRGGRSQKAGKQMRRSPSRTRDRSPPKKKPTIRKKGHCKKPTAGRKRGKAALRDTRIRSVK